MSLQFRLFPENLVVIVVGKEGGWLSCRMENKAVPAASDRSLEVQLKVARVSRAVEDSNKIIWKTK